MKKPLEYGTEKMILGKYYGETSARKLVSIFTCKRFETKCQCIFKPTSFPCSCCSCHLNIMTSFPYSPCTGGAGEGGVRKQQPVFLVEIRKIDTNRSECGKNGCPNSSSLVVSWVLILTAMKTEVTAYKNHLSGTEH